MYNHMHEHYSAQQREKTNVYVHVHVYIMSRFRSKLSSVFGVGNKKRPVVYCGRGRPPKKALMAGHMDGQVREVTSRTVHTHTVTQSHTHTHVDSHTHTHTHITIDTGEVSVKKLCTIQ